MAALASFTLIMAVNTAFVASSELMERVAHRYGFHWLIATNRRQSLYRIHLLNATFFSSIILITSGSQAILADMYALGLLASFCINMGALIIYRYFMGTKDVNYFTSRLGTLILWVILVSCFRLPGHRQALTPPCSGPRSPAVVLLAGFLVARKRAPETEGDRPGRQRNGDDPAIWPSPRPRRFILFPALRGVRTSAHKDNEAYITFYSPRAGIPPKTAANHFRFPLTKISLYHRLVSLLRVVEYELADRRVVVHFGWPLSSWWDRMAIGVMVFNLMRLPRLFPQFEFDIRYFRRPQAHAEATAGDGR